jgi:hypothetical protein
MHRVILTILAFGAFPILCSRGDEVTAKTANMNAIHTCQSTVVDFDTHGQLTVWARGSMRLKGDDEKKGCCCLLKDSGPPPVWDCSGYVDGTLVTRAQCKKDADELVVKFKWHEGKCTDKD